MTLGVSVLIKRKCQANRQVWLQKKTIRPQTDLLRKLCIVLYFTPHPLSCCPRVCLFIWRKYISQPKNCLRNIASYHVSASLEDNTKSHTWCLGWSEVVRGPLLEPLSWCCPLRPGTASAPPPSLLTSCPPCSSQITCSRPLDVS